MHRILAQVGVPHLPSALSKIGSRADRAIYGHQSGTATKPPFTTSWGLVISIITRSSLPNSEFSDVGGGIH